MTVEVTHTWCATCATMPRVAVCGADIAQDALKDTGVDCEECERLWDAHVLAQHTP